MDIFKLDDSTIDKLSEEDAKETLRHIRNQLQNRYNYLLGIWADSKKARLTSTGKIVSLNEIVSWLEDSDVKKNES